MLDVHPPHSRISGFTEFFLHLFTITIGLLIATQIEACVEWRHHLNSAAEARASLRQEIEENLKDLKDAQPGIQAWRKEVDKSLDIMRSIQAHPQDMAAQRSVSFALKFQDIALRDTAWKTAQSTNALAYMPYDEAREYSAIYERQDAFLAEQKKPEDDLAEISALIARFNWHEQVPISAEQASQMAASLNEMRLHLLFLDMILRGCAEQDAAFLEKRKASAAISEDFNSHITAPGKSR